MNLINILNRNTEGKIAAGAKDLQKIMKERKEFTIFGNIQVFVKDPLPEEIDLTNVIMNLEDSEKFV